MAGSLKKTPFLKQPYPYYYRGKSLLVIFLLLFIMSFGFNFFFKPFNVNLSEHKMPYFGISLMHTLTAGLIFLLLCAAFSFIHQKTEQWKISNEVIFLLLLFLCIGIGQFLIRDVIYDNPNNWSWKYFFEEVRNTFMVGILFVLILVPLNFSRLYYINQKQAGLLSLLREEFEPIGPVFIQTNQKSDDFYLNTSDLIYAKSEGNYVEIYMEEQSDIVRNLVRIPLKDLERQLRKVPYIVKTHRSFLVNTRYIQNISGNAQGYKLQLKQCPDPVSVSRNMIPSFEQHLQRSS